MTNFFRVVLAVVVCLVANTASAAAWTATEGDLVITQTSLGDFYSYYARNSSNSRLLEQPQGSVAQAGDVRRFGFLLNLEYGLTQRVTANLAVAYFATQHVSVGENIGVFTNSQPNSARGIQDFTGNVKYLAWQSEGPTIFAISPAIGWAVPLGKYDTSLNNPLGDGIISIDPTLHLSALVPPKLFLNLDLVYRIREDRSARVGDVWPAAVSQANPSLGITRTGGQIHDQVQAVFEAGYFITDSLSVRGIVKRIETLGGENLTFEGMPQMMSRGTGPLPMFENSLAYDQDALFLGAGPYWQINDNFGVGLTYVQAVWFRNFPNIKTGLLSLSYNPQLGRARAERALREQLAAEQAAAAEEAAAEEGAEGANEAEGTDVSPADTDKEKQP